MSLSESRWSASSLRVAAAMRGSTDSMTCNAARYALLAVSAYSAPRAAVEAVVAVRSAAMPPTLVGRQCRGDQRFVEQPAKTFSEADARGAVVKPGSQQPVSL